MAGDLNSLTRDLQEILTTLKIQYETTSPPDKKDRHVFENIRLETKPTFTKIDAWEKEANAQVSKYKKLFPNQIKNTKDNLELVLLHSFYIDVKRKRYMELYQSILYVFNEILEQENE